MEMRFLIFFLLKKLFLKKKEKKKKKREFKLDLKVKNTLVVMSFEK